jgi:hypothetical protein
MDGFNFVEVPRKASFLRPVRDGGADLEAQLALTPRLQEAAYGIRYEAYKSYGYVSERENGIFSDRYDQQVNCRTALIFKDGHAAATVRIATYDAERDDPEFHQVQAMEIFGHEIKATLAGLHSDGRTPRAAEIGKLARLTRHSKDMDIIFAVFRTVGYLILHQEIDVVFNAVREHHMPMYRRFGFQQLEAPRPYPGLTFKTGLMACFRANYDAARTGLPFLHGISRDDAAYAGLIAGERVAIFGDAAPMSVRPAAPAAPLSQRPDGLRRSA